MRSPEDSYCHDKRRVYARRGSSFAEHETVISLQLDTTLVGRLSAMARGRVLVIDAFRSWRCGACVGDLTIGWRHSPPGDGFLGLGPLDGVPVFVGHGLRGVLSEAGPSLVRNRLPWSSGLAIELERPELWLDFLEQSSDWSWHRRPSAASRIETFD